MYVYTHTHSHTLTHTHTHTSMYVYSVVYRVVCVYCVVCSGLDRLEIRYAL
jgi:hypothetical protein